MFRGSHGNIAWYRSNHLIQPTETNQYNIATHLVNITDIVYVSILTFTDIYSDWSNEYSCQFDSLIITDNEELRTTSNY